MYKIPKAKEAIDKEWKKLFDINAFGLDEVEEFEDVKDDTLRWVRRFISGLFEPYATRNIANFLCTSVYSREEWYSEEILSKMQTVFMLCFQSTAPPRVTWLRRSL